MQIYLSTHLPPPSEAQTTAPDPPGQVWGLQNLPHPAPDSACGVPPGMATRARDDSGFYPRRGPVEGVFREVLAEPLVTFLLPDAGDGVAPP